MFEETEMLIREKTLSTRAIIESLDKICKTIQVMITFKTEVRKNAQNMKQLIKEVVERGQEKTVEIREFLRLLDSLKTAHCIGVKQQTPMERNVADLPLKHEEDTTVQDVSIPSNSKLQLDKLNVCTSQLNPLWQDVDEMEKPTSNIRYCIF